MSPAGPMNAGADESAQREAEALLAAGDASPSLGLALQTVFSALRARDDATEGNSDTALLARVSGDRRWRITACGSILNERWDVTPDQLERAVAYCLKIVAQSSRSSYTTSMPSSPTAGNGGAAVFQGEPAFDRALIQAVSTLDRLCSEGHSGDLVPRVFTPLGKLFHRVVATNPLSPQSGLLLVPLLQFFLDHGDVVLYDAEPAIQTFFRTCLVKEYTDKAVARAALHFLLENKAKLKALSLPLFPRYFPLLFKTLAWSGDPDLDKAFLSLLPALLGPTSTLALFHTIVDLPTLVLALEYADRAAKDPEKMAALMEAAFMGSMYGDGGPKVTPQSPIRRPEARSMALEALYAELARDENDGVLPKAWASPEAAAAVEKEARGSPSLRLQHALTLAPALLDAYTDLVLRTSDEATLTPLAAFVIQRVNTLYPSEAFQAKIIRICSRFLLATFDRYRSLLALLKKPILQTISPPPTRPEQIELAVHLVWAVGEYHMGGFREHVAARQVFEALELVLYESLAASSALNAGRAEQSWRPSASDRPPMTSPRLLCVVITAITKLTNVHRELASRARVCIAKVARSKQAVDPHVWRKARECLGLMQEPAVCAALFSRGQQTIPGFA